MRIHIIGFRSFISQWFSKKTKCCDFFCLKMLTVIIHQMANKHYANIKIKTLTTEYALILFFYCKINLYKRECFCKTFLEISYFFYDSTFSMCRCHTDFQWEFYTEKYMQGEPSILETSWNELSSTRLRQLDCNRTVFPKTFLKFSLLMLFG